MPDSQMEQLVHEALNLVVRARKLDEGALGEHCRKLGSYAPQHTECLTPHLWLLDQYDTDLKEWERGRGMRYLGPGELYDRHATDGGTAARLLPRVLRQAYGG